MKIEKLVESYNDGFNRGYNAAQALGPDRIKSRRGVYAWQVKQGRSRLVAQYYAAGWAKGVAVYRRMAPQKPAPTPKPVTAQLIGLYTLKAT